MQSEWEVSRTSGQCSASGRPLAEGESYYAVLFETQQGFERRDYTEDTWTGPPEGHFCYWRARVPVRNKPAGPVAVDHALLTQLFLRLEEKDSDVHRQFRFVLALLLMRKRILKLDKTEREGERESWLMRLVSDQSDHRVLNPRLGPEEVERLSGQLTAVLSGDPQVLQSLESSGSMSEAGGESTAADRVAAGEISDDEPGR